MRVSKLAAGLGAAGAIALVLSGCSGGGDTAAPDDAITVAVGEPDSLLPGNHFASYEVLTSVFSALTSFDDAGELVYLAAESVESDDATNWTITLRDGWTFHNGDPVTAQSYVDAWNTVAYGPNAMVNAGQLKRVVGFDDLNPAEGEPTTEEMSGLQVVDDLTFTVQLVTADRQFPLQLSPGQTGLYPMPEAAFDDLEAYSRQPIGNGPLQLTEPWVDNTDIVATEFEDYTGPEPTVSSITFRPYQDVAIAYTDVLGGNIDLASVPASKIAVAESDFGDRLYSLDAPGVDYLGFPIDDPRFADKRIRQAISMSIDRDAVNEAIWAGTQIPATSLTAPSMPGDPAGICGEYCEFDPEAAKALLEEAGGFDGTIEITFVGGWGEDAIFEAYANQIRQNLGVDAVATAATDFAEFNTLIADNTIEGPHRARWGALYPSQQDTLHAVFTAAGDGNPYSRYSNAEVDALLAEADSADTLEESYELYAGVQERILEDFPTVPTFANRYSFVTSDRISDVSSISGSPVLYSVELAG